jgi:hypothetical protein
MANHESNPRPRPIPLRELLGMDAAPAPAASDPRGGGRAPADDGARASGPPADSRAVAPAPDPAAGDAPRPFALVDGSNVAHAGEGAARLANILIVRDKLRAEGFEPLIVADAALRHQVDDLAGYERLVAEGSVKQAPAGTDADYFILSFAKELDAAIVSNDQFRDRSRQFAEVRRRVIRFMILADEVVFEKRTSKRKS